MTDRYFLSPRAQADIDAIYDYTALHWGESQAELYIRQLRSALEIIADTRAGRACNEIRTGYYKYPSGSHLLFYRWTGAGAEIVRILHQSMDVDHHL